MKGMKPYGVFNQIRKDTFSMGYAPLNPRNLIGQHA